MLRSNFYRFTHDNYFSWTHEITNWEWLQMPYILLSWLLHREAFQLQPVLQKPDGLYILPGTSRLMPLKNALLLLAPQCSFSAWSSQSHCCPMSLTAVKVQSPAGGNVKSQMGKAVLVSLVLGKLTFEKHKTLLLPIAYPFKSIFSPALPPVSFREKWPLSISQTDCHDKNKET